MLVENKKDGTGYHRISDNSIAGHPSTITIQDMLKGVNDSQGKLYFQKADYGSPYTFSEFKPDNNNAHRFCVYFAKDKSKTDKYKRSPYAFYEFKSDDNYADGYVL